MYIVSTAYIADVANNWIGLVWNGQLLVCNAVAEMK
jgi:hypothetical protein